MTNLTQEYITKDLPEAGLLFTKGFKLDRIERKGKVCWFVFVNWTECKKTADQFWFGECLIDAKAYSEALSTLKNRIFASS